MEARYETMFVKEQKTRSKSRDGEIQRLCPKKWVKLEGLE